MKLNDVLAHRRHCFIEKKACIFGCGQILKGREQHSRHAIEDCPKVDTICKNCEGHTLREEQVSHDCVPNLISKVDSSKDDSFKVALEALRE